MSPGTVLVTGGCGFIGSRLCDELLAAGYPVAVLDNLSRGSADALSEPARRQVVLVEGDITDREAVVRTISELRPAAVVHLAAMHFIPDCDRDPTRCIQINLGGTQEVFEACRRLQPLPDIVLASSAAVYKPAPGALRETSELGPTDVYGLTKLWSEQLLELLHWQTGVTATAARLFNVYGEGETNPHLIPSLICQAKAAVGKLRVGNLETRRDYVYVGDVARALLSMLEHRQEGSLRAFNVGTGAERSGLEVISMLGSLLGWSPELADDPTRQRKVDRASLLSDPGRAHRELEWHPSTTFSDGLAAALRQPLAPGAEGRL